MTTQTSYATSETAPQDFASEADLHITAGPSLSPSRAIAVLSGFWVAIFFASLFAPPLLDDADATHSNAARHILTSGDWVTLYVNGIRYLEKAPLPYWIDAVSFRLFGFNAFAAHLPQSIAVFILALLGYVWAAKAFNPRTGLYTGTAVLTSAGVFLFTRVFIPEIWLSLFLATALYAFLQSLESRGSPTRKSAVIPSGAESSSGAREAVILSGARSAQSKDPERLNSPTGSEPFRHQLGAPFIAPLSQAMGGHSREGANRLHFAYPYLLWTSLALSSSPKPRRPGLHLRHRRRLPRPHRRVPPMASPSPVTGILLFLAIAAPWHILAGLRNTTATSVATRAVSSGSTSSMSTSSAFSASATRSTTTSFPATFSGASTSSGCFPGRSSLRSSSPGSAAESRQSSLRRTPPAPPSFSPSTPPWSSSSSLSPPIRSTTPSPPTSRC